VNYQTQRPITIIITDIKYTLRQNFIECSSPDIVLFDVLFAANITAHYMAMGQRVLITSKSSEALNVIREKIADEVFEDSSQLKDLIISWGDETARKRFSDAALVLTNICRDGAVQDKKMKKNIEDRKRHSEAIAGCEKKLRVNSKISVTQSLKDFAIPCKSSDPNRVSTLAMALALLEVCDVTTRGKVKEIQHKALLDLARMIRDEKFLDTTEGSFAFFVEDEIKIALKDEGRRKLLLAWYKENSSTLYEQVKALKAKWASSEEKDYVAEIMPRVLTDLQSAGLRTWAQQILEAIHRSEDSIDTIVPSDWQLFFVLLSCKHFLVELSQSVPCASRDNKDIEDRKYFEDERRQKMKELVGHETLKHAIERYRRPNFSRKLQEFINIYAQIETMLGTKGKKPKKYYRLEHDLQKLLQDGELMSALPIWIMPSDRVSEILPANIGLFDLVILEEASQSDCQCIPVLLRGKKLIIIGDNKQLNPPGAPEEYKKTILDNLGTELPVRTRQNILPGKSVFDLFANVFKGPCTPIWLREHFRCYCS
jgi:hypothetical protein